MISQCTVPKWYKAKSIFLFVTPRVRSVAEGCRNGPFPGPDEITTDKFRFSTYFILPENNVQVILSKLKRITNVSIQGKQYYICQSQAGQYNSWQEIPKTPCLLLNTLIFQIKMNITCLLSKKQYITFYAYREHQHVSCRYKLMVKNLSYYFSEKIFKQTLVILM